MNLVLCRRKYVGIWLLVFFCSIHVKFPMYVGGLKVKTSPIEGTYLFDTSKNSHFRPNLSEDLQQCIGA